MAKTKAAKQVASQKRRQNRRPGRPTKNTPDWAPAFLEAVRRGMCVVHATAFAGVRAETPYERAKKNAEFSAAWDEAAEIGEKRLLQEASRRAYHGTAKPVFHKGKVCGYIQEYSDTLIMFLLRALNPKKYREKHQQKHQSEHSGPDGAVVPISIVRFRRHSDVTLAIEHAAPVSAGDGI
jgi:hypothetical protein